MKEKLKQCPFCGREPRIETWIAGGQVRAYVACQACFASGSPSGGRDSDKKAISEAVEAWNRRIREES